MAKVFDLEERCAQFSQDLFTFLARLPKVGPNPRLFDQLHRSGPSIGQNYVESCDALGKKDRLMKLRTARREASETRFSLRLTVCPDGLKADREALLQEVFEIRNILSFMIRKYS